MGKKSIILSIVSALGKGIKAAMEEPPPAKKGVVIRLDKQFKRDFLCAVAGESKTNADGTKRQSIIRKLAVGQKMMLVREPDNAYDPNAIIVCTEAKEQIGYVNRETAQRLAKQLDNGLEYAAFIEAVTGGEPGKPTRGCVLRLFIF
jgi:hypothetical protein